MLGNVPVAVVNCEPSCDNRSPYDVVGDRFPRTADSSHHLLHVWWPRIPTLDVLHPVRSLPFVNHGRETIFEQLEISDVPCLQVRRQPSKNHHHHDLRIDSLRLDVLCYVRSHGVPNEPSGTARVQNCWEHQVDPLQEKFAANPRSLLVRDVNCATFLDRFFLAFPHQKKWQLFLCGCDGECNSDPHRCKPRRVKHDMTSAGDVPVSRRGS